MDSGSPGNLVATTTNFLFDADTISAPALTETAEDPTDPAEFSAFKVANCSLTTIKMDCRNWVVKESKEDTDAGLIHYTEGLSVKFWWFDGRAYDDNTAETLDASV